MGATLVGSAEELARLRARRNDLAADLESKADKVGVAGRLRESELQISPWRRSERAAPTPLLPCTTRTPSRPTSASAARPTSASLKEGTLAAAAITPRLCR